MIESVGSDGCCTYITVTDEGTWFTSGPSKNYDVPEKYIFNNATTILIWKDKTKTIIKRAKDDKDSKLIAFLTAYFQKNSGMSKKKANDYLDKIKELDKDGLF